MLLGICCRKRKIELKNKINITSVFSAEKLNGNSAKQLLSLVFLFNYNFYK